MRDLSPALPPIEVNVRRLAALPLELENAGVQLITAGLDQLEAHHKLLEEELRGGVDDLRNLFKRSLCTLRLYVAGRDA